jgi:hypothetical protein
MIEHIIYSNQKRRKIMHFKRALLIEQPSYAERP